MNVDDDVALAVLHRLRIRGKIAADQLPADAATLGELAEQGVLRLSERGCTLTGAGLRRHAELLTGERARIDLAGVERAYERFLAVNQPVKDSCALWQARSAQADEDDAIRAVDGLEGLLERVRPSLERVAVIVPRFARYPRGLENALDQAAQGDSRYLVEPRIDSFHTVWFECHEDYLLTLGRERDDEEREHDQAR